MGLIKMKSSLTDVKFGKDRPGGGSSNQPYIVSKIPGVRSGTTALDNILDKSTLKLERSAKDVSRLVQYFTDLKSFSGIGFSLNQNILSRQTSDLRAGSKNYMSLPFSIPGGIYNPINTLSQVGEVAFGQHYQKQGLIPKGGLIGNVISFLDDKLNLGLSNYNLLEQPKYLDFYKGKGGNAGYFESRLENLHVSKGYEYENPNKNKSTVDKFQFTPKSPVNYFNNIFNNSKNIPPEYIITNDKAKKRGETIYSYYGGPNLVKTDVKFYQNSLNSPLTPGSKTYEKYRTLSENNYLGLDPLSNKYLNTSSELLKLNTYKNKKNLPGTRKHAVGKSLEKETYNSSDIAVVNIIKPGVLLEDSFAKIEDIASNSDNKLAGYPNIVDFRTVKNPDYPAWGGVFNADGSYKEKPRILMNDPAHRKKPGNNHTGNNFTKSKYIVDEINASGLLKMREVAEMDDLAKFRIGILDRKTQQYEYIQFRAFIDNFSDGYSSEWDTHQFMGRGEKFYKYKGFDRDIDLSFTVAALSRKELIPMYKKLNYLASTLAPDYGDNGYMSGNIANLTIGGYVYQLPGIIQGINIAPHEDSPWEIGLKYNGKYSGEGGVNNSRDESWDHDVKELPMVIKVTGFKFKPIHNFTPRIQKDYEKGSVRFISLAKGSGKQYNNYDS